MVTKFLRPSHPPGSSIRRLEYPDHLQLLTLRRVYDTLAKRPLCGGEIPGEDLLPAQEASSKSDTYIKGSTVLRQKTAG